MAPESHARVRRQRSPSRPRPVRSPSRPRPDDQRARARHRPHEPPVRAKSRPPPQGLHASDGRSPTTSSAKRPRVRFSVLESEGAAAALAATATYSGLLRKQADNQPGAWNEYFFVVKPLTYLFYYNSKDDETPRGIIDLEYLTDVKRNADCLQRAVGASDNCFRVSGKLPRPTAEQTLAGDVPKMRPLFLDARDDRDALEWMQAIRSHRFSLKKDQQFAEAVAELREAKLKVLQLEDAQQHEREMQWALRVKAKTLLQKMRAVESGSSLDDVTDAEVDVDDRADDMLAMLEGMEDVLVNLQAKLAHLCHQQQEAASKKADKTGGARRGFTQVLQRAGHKREDVGPAELLDEATEETLAAIRNRRQRKLTDAVVPVTQDEPKAKGKDTCREKPKEKLKGSAREDPAPVVDNVSDVLAMWKAKKKSSLTSKQPTSDEDGETARKHRTPSTAARSVAAAAVVVAPEPSERLSEEDTASLDSTEVDQDTGERLPPGWTKHESRGYPGTYYYANEDGQVSWDVPTDDMNGSPRSKSEHGFSDRDDRSESGADNVHDDNDVVRADEDQHLHTCSTDVQSEEDEGDTFPTATVDVSSECHSEHETDVATAGGTTSAAYRKLKPKPKSAWAFKLPKLLPTHNQTAAPAETMTSSLSPILRGANHHEF
ncbi:unnamed protein product [Hyaloperonospora brassicae]|uniref:WW domain-containing protein n=1 Tax=Hyaloperonospora brassicae TaxID=162125 RepID=A0AAV0THP0_HYABA|nr:unnamed protein product [Hyaloperonospora brassicae]